MDIIVQLATFWRDLSKNRGIDFFLIFDEVFFWEAAGKFKRFVGTINASPSHAFEQQRYFEEGLREIRLL